MIRTISLGCFVCGLLLILYSLLYDYLFLSGSPGFGLAQKAMILSGFILLVFSKIVTVKAVNNRVKNVLSNKYVFRMFLIFVGIGLTFLLIEILFYLYFYPLIASKNEILKNEYNLLSSRINDKDLGFRIKHAEGLFDKNGFRNENIPNNTDIVAIGDSQTWGINVLRNDNWPTVLSELTGMSIYNMSVGGYGPVQYYKLFVHAINLNPKFVFIGLYFGNDFYDSYDSVYLINLIKKYKTNIELVDNNFIELESEDISKSLEEYRSLNNKSNSGVSLILNNIALFKMIHNYKINSCNNKSSNFAVAKGWAIINPTIAHYYHDSILCTIFMSKYRYLALNYKDPIINEGLNITENIMNDINKLGATHNIDIAFVLIPTKEKVYEDLVSVDNLEPNLQYEYLVNSEEIVRKRILSYCKLNNIKCIDTLASLKGALELDKPIYMKNHDGHPNKEGYAYIAKSVYKWLHQ